MSESELPDFIDQEMLQDIPSVNIPDEAILRCFVNANKPFLSNSAVANMTEFSNEGARQRLNDLVDRGVLLSTEAGKQTKIYWLNDPRSRWPVPGDLEDSPKKVNDRMVDTLVRINRLTTWTLFYASIAAGFYVLDWLSGRQFTDGIFEVTLNWTIMPALAFALLAVVFHIALQTSLLVENDDAGWPTIRRVYRTLIP